MLDAVKLRTDPGVGLFQSREDALNEQISALDKRIRLQQDDLSRYEDSLVRNSPPTRRACALRWRRAIRSPR
jgi:hypothetical protein